MSDLVIEWEGKPIPQKRHRHTKRGFTYDPSKKDKDNVILQIRHLAPKTPIESDISLYIRFSMPYAKKYYRTGKYSNELKPNPPKSHCIKPDIDNLLKFVFDMGNKLLWKDDSQIYRVQMEKVYSTEPSTKLIIIEEE